MVSVWRYDNETAILSLRSLFVGKATRHEANGYISMIAPTGIVGLIRVFGKTAMHKVNED